MSSNILRGVTNKDHKALLRKAMKAGCVITQTPSGHLRIATPEGGVIICGLTTASMSFKHTRRDLRKAGVDV